MVKNIKRLYRSYLDSFRDFSVLNWVIFGFVSFFILIFVLVYKWVLWLILIVLVLFWLVMVFQNRRFINSASANGAIVGNRGKGKGILIQKLSNSFPKVFSNVPMGNNTEVINISEYINSIGSNTILDTINDTVQRVNKILKFEGVPVIWDDITVYAPNFMDNVLKVNYPSLALVLAINRHLYNSFMVITVQNRERAYKLLRELQTDYTIKALRTFGFGKLMNSLPLIRFFAFVKYRYYEEVKSADNGVLPFKAIGAVNKVASPIYLTGGQATKEVFEAENGKVYHGYIGIRKSRLYYDTRYFHQLFYGVKAPSINKKKNDLKKND